MTARFKNLVEKHRDWVYTFAFYNLGDREEAEDTTQEVMMRLWNNLENVNEETVTAWIRRVTTNACIDTVRRRRAYRARIVASGEADDFAQAVSHEPEPDVSAESSELRAYIQTALATLKEPYRSIVIMREIQDMKYEQISEGLHLPLNTIKSYLHRGRSMLRDQLREKLRHESI
jgi:RNA polymerase sigma-70 factor (ECF subfamily)